MFALEQNHKKRPGNYPRFETTASSFLPAHSAVDSRSRRIKFVPRYENTPVSGQECDQKQKMTMTGKPNLTSLWIFLKTGILDWEYPCRWCGYEKIELISYRTQCFLGELKPKSRKSQLRERKINPPLENLWISNLRTEVEDLFFSDCIEGVRIDLAHCKCWIQSSANSEPETVF
jgi:hypothetical protein